MLTFCVRVLLYPEVRSPRPYWQGIPDEISCQLGQYLHLVAITEEPYQVFLHFPKGLVTIYLHGMLSVGRLSVEFPLGFIGQHGVQVCHHDRGIEILFDRFNGQATEGFQLHNVLLLGDIGLHSPSLEVELLEHAASMSLLLPEIGGNDLGGIWKFHTDQADLDPGVLIDHKSAFEHPLDGIGSRRYLHELGPLARFQELPDERHRLLCPDHELALPLLPEVQGKDLEVGEVPVVDADTVLWQHLDPPVSQGELAGAIGNDGRMQDQPAQHIVVVEGLCLDKAAVLVALSPKMSIERGGVHQGDVRSVHGNEPVAPPSPRTGRAMAPMALAEYAVPDLEKEGVQLAPLL